MTTVGAVADGARHAQEAKKSNENRELDRIRARVQSLFGVSGAQYEASCSISAVSCRVVLTSILVSHCKFNRATVAEYMGIDEAQMAGIEAVFRGFYAVYSVPAGIDVAALAANLRDFFRGKEDRLDLTSFRRAPQLSVVRTEVDGDVASTGRITAIARAVCDFLDAPFEAVLGAGRPRDVVMARRVAMYGARHLTKSSFPLIARHLGGRDHTAVLYACRQMEIDLRGQRPPESIGVAELLTWLADRLPELSAQRGAALSRRKKQQKAFNQEMAA